MKYKVLLNFDLLKSGMWTGYAFKCHFSLPECIQLSLCSYPCPLAPLPLHCRI